MNERLRVFLKQNAGYFAVAFISFIHIMTAFISIDKTGKTPAQILADGAISFFLGLFINRIFDFQGIISGEREERVIRTKDLHSQMVFRISPHIEKLDAWCDAENARNYKVQRTKILAREGLRYEECFDENGVAKDYQQNAERLKNKKLRKIELKKINAYVKAAKLKLTPLSTNVLTSEGDRPQDPFYLGKTKAQFEAERSVGDIVSKLGIAVIFGCYGVKLIDGFNYAALLWNTLQVAMFIAMGVINMYKSYSFIVDEFRGRLMKKIDNLQKFENYINSLPKDAKNKTEDKEDEHGTEKRA